MNKDFDVTMTVDGNTRYVNVAIPMDDGEATELQLSFFNNATYWGTVAAFDSTVKTGTKRKNDNSDMAFMFEINESVNLYILVTKETNEYALSITVA